MRFVLEQTPIFHSHFGSYRQLCLLNWHLLEVEERYTTQFDLILGTAMNCASTVTVVEGRGVITLLHVSH